MKWIEKTRWKMSIVEILLGLASEVYKMRKRNWDSLSMF